MNLLEFDEWAKALPQEEIHCLPMIDSRVAEAYMTLDWIDVVGRNVLTHYKGIPLFRSEYLLEFDS